MPDADASMHVRLLSHEGGFPVPDHPVKLVLTGTGPERSVHLGLTKTGHDGSAAPRFRIPDWPDGTYELRVTADTDRGAETVTREVKLRRSWRVMLSTDKPIYQPGQVIHLRGLALRAPRPEAARRPGNGLRRHRPERQRHLPRSASRRVPMASPRSTARWRPS